MNNQFWSLQVNNCWIKFSTFNEGMDHSELRFTWDVSRLLFFIEFILFLVITFAVKSYTPLQMLTNLMRQSFYARCLTSIPMPGSDTMKLSLPWNFCKRCSGNTPENSKKQCSSSKATFYWKWDLILWIVIGNVEYLFYACKAVVPMAQSAFGWFLNQEPRAASRRPTPVERYDVQVYTWYASKRTDLINFLTVMGQNYESLLS